MPKFLLPLLLCLSVLAGHAVAAENADTPPAGQLNWGSCFVAPPPPLDMPDSDVPDGEYEVFSGQAKFDRSGNILFDDKISLVSGKKMLRADSAEYDSVAGVFEVEGQVEFRDPETRVRASRAEYNQQTQEIEFQNATFELWSVPARGESSFIKAGGDGKLRLNDVSYTTCPEGNDDWYIRAKKIRIDRNKGIGTAQHARLNFKGVPVLYFPYISYPVSDQRKTGWLIPKLGTSQQRGVDISAPFYWNIAPQYDATLTPRFMSKRGGQLATEFRYLSSNSDGVLTTEWMPNDDETDQHRALVSLDHTTNFTSELRGRIDAIQVSDGQYFEDLSSGLQATSQTNLRRYADLEFFNDVWSTTLRFEDYQTLDDAIIDEDEPYTMLPRLTVNGYDANGPLGLRYQLDGELTYFYRDVGVTGIRGNVLPEVSFKKRLYFFDIEPSFAFDYTGYKLDDTAAGADTTPNRTAPIYSVDATSVFERITKKRGWLQTLEPRAFYTYIPFRNQDDLPVFDTIESDLNVVQLFRKNRFVGQDRLGDTNQISLGVTTRLIDNDDGEEFLKATVGQIFYLDDLEVTLPGGEPSDSNSSDYLAELGIKLYGQWRMQLGYQFNSDESETRRTEARLSYRGSDEKIANFSYRYRRESLEELDISGAWPIAGNWNIVGRYNYSIFDSKPLDRFVGLEYETCCWSVRTVFRRNLTNTDGESDTSVAIQLQLKGLGSNGSAADRWLDRGILDYQ